uniref:CCHC-type domain-containing protein n=1 Tax=Sander lucioperca TaxID=283035 RepID=A0A8D0CPZ8_SANLU
FSGGGQLSKRITISNAPPFIKNDDLDKELSRYGQLMSPIKMVLLGCKSPKLKHVVCHRRQAFMILKDNAADLNLTFSFKVEGFSYVVFATLDTMKCFGCGEEGHLVRFCPRLPAPDPAETAPGPTEPAPGPAGSGGWANRAAEPPGVSEPPGGSDSDVAPPAADSDSAGAQQCAETAQVTEKDTQEKERDVAHNEGGDESVNEGHNQCNEKAENNRQTGKRKSVLKEKAAVECY